MIIIKMCGGLGNQMFQYALYQAFLEREIEVKLDLGKPLENRFSHSSMNLFDIFGITPVKASQKEIDRYIITGQGKIRYVNSAINKLFHTKSPYVQENKEGNYDDTLLNLVDAYLDGYWQSEKYFSDIQKKIRESFRFQKKLSQKSIAMVDRIKSCACSVSVHIRKGDYLSEMNRKIYGGICTDAYYHRAIEYFKTKYEDVVFFLFSNDTTDLERYKVKNGYVIVDCNDEENGWQDMYLMSLCHHHTIANSSFSWWGAWLNRNAAKEVVAPKKWLNTKKMDDICPENWIRI